MNIFIPFVGDDFTYFDLFQEAAFDNRLSTFWKIVFMSPTSILAILTVLHILEPKSEFVTRNYLAISGIIGFLLYLLIYGLMYVAVTLAIGAGDILVSWITGNNQQSAGIGALDLGWTPVLYPILFLTYVLVHRYMKYDFPEIEYEKYDNNTATKRTYDDNEFL